MCKCDLFESYTSLCPLTCEEDRVCSKLAEAIIENENCILQHFTFSFMVIISRADFILQKCSMLEKEHPAESTFH